ncbi:hypothetical protein CAL29_14840 [Bordetella genomosp. 10]|uniref:HTH lysR-type domain-containing protein n=1 Tax=Bordetella genomosp. 10 TaxID=1416804 RepID=A0A261SBH0_9BORD|nr:LysR family transcriptional regulator [Bordetella genomosp. 10]OZI34744.1 hypothetical protein CAL29_14840 [Bordetella genomosp. 10]
MRNVSLRQIEAFLVAAEKLSFSRAAEAMSVTQSAFSQLIRELESKLDVRLFDRTTRRVRLTEPGQVLLRKMKRGVAEIDDACEEARAIARAEHGHLSVAALPSLAIGIVMRTLQALHRAHPQVTFDIREDFNGALLQRVTAGDADFAVCAHSAMAADLDFEWLFDDELVAVMAKSQARGLPGVLPWSAMHDRPLIMTLNTSSTREQVSAALARNRVRTPHGYDVANMFTALSMARAGFGVTFLPVRALCEVDMKGLAWLPMAPPAPFRPIGICRRRDRTPSPVTLKFEALLREQVAQHRG